MFLAFAKGLGIDDDLMFLVDCRHPVIALERALRSRHLGTLVVSEIALHLLASPALPLSGALRLQEVVNLGHGPVEGEDHLGMADITLQLFLALCPVMLKMLLQVVANQATQLVALFSKLLEGARPLLGSVGRHLATVDGKEFITQQALLVADQQDLFEQGFDLVGMAADEPS